MSKEILIHIKEGERYAAVIEDGKLDDFHIELDRQDSTLGNIYKGKVETILPSINGAFVNIGHEKNGFLYLTDAINPLVEAEISPTKRFINKLLNRPEKKEKKDHKPIPFKEGDEVLVQVVKEPFGTKGARLTTHISLAGRFVVYMPYDQHVGVSKRIEEGEERHRLKELLKELDFGQTGGFIVRTASLQKGKRELIRDAKFLITVWRKIKKLAEEKSAPALIYKEYDLVWRVIRDYLREDVDKVFVDSQEEYGKIRRFVHNLIGKEMLDKIHCYKGEAPIFEAKNVSRQLEKIYDKRVYLKSGAYIVIEPTEGLIVVDVNSGRFKANASPEEAAFLVNKEAAPEIARQLRLRDLGGIIVIDFIDMSRENHKRQVVDALELALEKDYAKTEVMKISSLGLVEMTRARTGKTLESISFQDCPYCDGRGRIKID
ncbi:MAG: Rne/Rng family ribonuclease [Candidatus Omnitrophota bacterium]